MMSIPKAEGRGGVNLLNVVQHPDGRLNPIVYTTRGTYTVGHPIPPLELYQTCQLTAGSDALHEYAKICDLPEEKEDGTNAPSAIDSEHWWLQLRGSCVVAHDNGLSDIYLPRQRKVKQLGWGPFIPQWSLEALPPPMAFDAPNGIVSAIRRPDGVLQLFSRKRPLSYLQDGIPKTSLNGMPRMQTQDGPWGDATIWYYLFRDPDRVLELSVVLGAGDRISVLASNYPDGKSWESGDLWRTEASDAKGTFEGSWWKVKDGGGWPTQVRNASGRAEAVTGRRDWPGGRLWHSWQQDDLGTWSDWQEIDRPGLFLSDILFSQTKMIVDSEGRVNLFAKHRSINGLLPLWYPANLWWSRQNTPEAGSGWSEFERLSKDRDGSLGTVDTFEVRKNTDGRLEIWADSGGGGDAERADRGQDIVVGVGHNCRCSWNQRLGRELEAPGRDGDWRKCVAEAVSGQLPADTWVKVVTRWGFGSDSYGALIRPDGGEFKCYSPFPGASGAVVSGVNGQTTPIDVLSVGYGDLWLRSPAAGAFELYPVWS